MTSTTKRTAPPRVLAWATAAGTLPYLALKVLWLSGNPVGVTDPAFLQDISVVVLNGVTVAMDGLVVALAFALTHPWGRRLPVWALLLPVWVGTGFLVPMAVAILPVTLLELLGPTPSAGPGGSLAPWVQPIVYGGFAWQGVFLAGAFAAHARARWASTVTATRPAPDALLRVLVGGGSAAAAVSAALLVAFGMVWGGSGATMANAGFAVAAAVGVQALVRGTRHRWAAATAAFVGSSAMFSWGLWAAVNSMAGTALGASDPLGGPALLAGLLGGFALAVAGLTHLSRP